MHVLFCMPQVIIAARWIPQRSQRHQKRLPRRSWSRATNWRWRCAIRQNNQQWRLYPHGTRWMGETGRYEQRWSIWQWGQLLFIEGKRGKQNFPEESFFKRSSMCKQTKPHLAHLGCQLPSRAQSFGGNYLRNQPNRIPPTVNLPDVERKTSAAVGNISQNLQPPEEDPRKRAFSLGSRHFFK